MASKKLRALLEIVLAFGNYLNSGKRGPAYGFKLQSLDSLVDAKSADRRFCLLHFIVDTINKKMPELANFNSELHFIEKAATGIHPLWDNHHSATLCRFIFFFLFNSLCRFICYWFIGDSLGLRLFSRLLRSSEATDLILVAIYRGRIVFLDLFMSEEYRYNQPDKSPREAIGFSMIRWLSMIIVGCLRRGWIKWTNEMNFFCRSIIGECDDGRGGA